MNKATLGQTPAWVMLGVSCLGIVSSIFGIIYDGIMLKGGLYTYLDGISILWLAILFGYMALISLFPARTVQIERFVSQDCFQKFLLVSGVLGIMGCGYVLLGENTANIFSVVFTACIYLFFVVRITRQYFIKNAS